MRTELARRTLLGGALASIGAAGFASSSVKSDESSLGLTPLPMPPMPSVARRMAEWVSNLQYDELPSQVVDMVRKCLLDQIGCQLYGSTLPHVQPAFLLTEELEGRPESAIAGKHIATTASYAALVNATFGHGCEFDDSHEMGGHPGVCVIPAALALAQRNRASGRDLIVSIVAGYQIMILSGAVVLHRMMKQGWHNTKVQGPFGAAAAASKILHLNPDQIVNALAIAGSEASGPMEYDQSGGEVKRFHAGSASRSGMQAALLAQKGLTGPATIFEGRRGIYHLFGNGIDEDPEYYWKFDYHIRQTMFKLSPAVFTIHGAIQAALRIREKYKVTPDAIQKIEVDVSELTYTHGGTIIRPTDLIGAQFSLAYSLGLSFVRGRNVIEDYRDPASWRDPQILAIADKVVKKIAPVAPGASFLGAKVTVTLRDGRTITEDQPIPRGHFNNPASFDDLHEKFSTLSTGLISKSKASQIKDLIANIEDCADCSELALLISRSKGSS